MSQHHPLQKRKNSGVTWIGDIPAHWQVARIKAISTSRNARQTELPTGALYIGLEDVESGSGSYRPTAGSSRKSDDSTVSIFRDRDVLYGKLRPYLKKAIVAQGDGACSTEFLVLDVESKGLVKPEWLHGWLLTHDVTQRIEAGCDGAKMPRASWEHVSSIHIPVPPPEEQAEILESLDGKTSRIDTLIAKKTRFIELLKEKRQAVIAKAVTKGLDGAVEMKDSRIPWMGAIPAHWRAVPSNWLFLEIKDRAQPDDQHLSASQKYGVIPLSEFERLEGRRVTHAEKNLDQRKHVEVGDFVISMRSFQGGIEIVKARGCVRSSYVALRAGTSVDSRFFSYLFKSSAYIQGLQSTATFIRDGQDLSYANFRQVKLPLLCMDEQVRIASYLNRVVSRIDVLVSKTERSIELLKEHRSALITAAVTGKIDVREAA